MKARIPEPYVGGMSDRIFFSILLLADWVTLAYLIGAGWWYSFTDTGDYDLNVVEKLLVAIVLTFITPIIHYVISNLVWAVAARVWGFGRFVCMTVYEKLVA
jgi:hypothetical protein